MNVAKQTICIDMYRAEFTQCTNYCIVYLAVECFVQLLGTGFGWKCRLHADNYSTVFTCNVIIPHQLVALTVLHTPKSGTTKVGRSFNYLSQCNTEER